MLRELGAHRAMAVVRGTMDYTVVVTQLDSPHAVVCSCECQYFADHSICKHVWAVLLTIESVRAGPAEAEQSCADADGAAHPATLPRPRFRTAETPECPCQGTITLEIINLGDYPIELHPSMPICQLVVEEVRGVPFRNDSQFQGQVRAVGGG